MKITYKSGSETNGVKRLVVDVTYKRFFGLGPAVTETVEYVQVSPNAKGGGSIEWFEPQAWEKVGGRVWDRLHELWLYHETFKREKP